MADQGNGIPFDAVSQIDLEDLEGLRPETVEARLRELAEAASGAQLRLFLDGALVGDEDDPDIRSELTRRFVERRMLVIRSMSGVDAAFAAFYDALREVGK